MSPGRTRLARFHNRSPAERRLLVRAAILFVAAHAIARMREVDRMRARMRGLARRIGVSAADPDQLSWAVAVIGRDLPGKHTCLIRALCCEAIAANSGIPTEFRLGAAHQAGRMHFHAWVEHNGAVLTGEHDGTFAPLV